MKLIVDGDLLLFRSCAAVEKEVPVGDHRILMSNMNDALAVLDDFVLNLEQASGCTDVIFALSDAQNWRRNVLPTYKSNRKGVRKPMCYGDLLEYVGRTFEVLKFKGIEADDIMGIYCSRPGYVIWTLDKDLKQCPGMHLIDDEVVEITTEEGDWFHYYQTLIGDVTDGYTGCPGIGDKAAREFLEAPFKVTPEQQELKSGKNKGELRLIWTKEPTDNIWEGIVSIYEKAGLTEADALAQARVARILRDGEYDFEKERVRLWRP